MATISHVKILERHHVSPPPTSAPPPPPLPLTYFDIPWLLFSPSQPLFFYHFPSSTSHFTTTILPTLKHSLSLTLQHFYPLAGNLSLPPSPAAKPHFVFSHTDSVLLTLAESSADLTHLISNHPGDAQQFHPLVPPLPQHNGLINVPLLSVQLTLFPNSAGVCIGIAFQRAVADERTFNHFLKSWASICRQKLEFKSTVKITNPVPSFDRTPILDPKGLEPIFLEQLWSLKPSSKRGRIQDNMVRATFLLSLSDMERVKKWIVTRCNVINLSSYVLTCSYIWVCLIKAQVGTTQTNPKDVDYKKALYFGFIAGGITRLKFPVPTSYFGNCIAFGICTAQRNELLGEDGIIVAAKAVADAIEELNGDVLGGAERWVPEWRELFGRSAEDDDQLHVMVVGSPKVDLYGTDFGWGRPKKIEQVSIDSKIGAISFTESRDHKGGIEVGLVLPQPQMLAFTSLSSMMV